MTEPLGDADLARLREIVRLGVERANMGPVAAFVDAYPDTLPALLARLDRAEARINHIAEHPYFFTIDGVRCRLCTSLSMIDMTCKIDPHHAPRCEAGRVPP